MNTPESTFRAATGALHSPPFDALLIGGTLAIALTAWSLVHIDPVLFGTILALDLWLLGYHHVIATYTRLAPDLQTVRDHRFLIFVLPVLVLAGVVAMASMIGIIAVASTYLYWQWWHYLRQSEGISKAYLGKCGRAEAGRDPFLRIFFYGLPLASFLTMIDRQPSYFLNMPVFTFGIADALLHLVWAVALGAAAVFFWRTRRQWRRGEFSIAYTAYLASHVTIFLVGYALTESIDYGWLAINIWHNAQYLLFVWLFNRRRYKDGVQSRGWFLSFISQPNRWWLYFLALFTLTTVFYFLVDEVIALVQSTYAIPLTIIAYQTINFHHYIVDSLIWKLRKPVLRKNLGLSRPTTGTET
ncbi:MAG: hypothetical protein RQ826_13685 [Xanthomonadales bacterium]|nr:hypothetical protein [Xanthomonadales bacterium]